MNRSEHLKSEFSFMDFTNDELNESKNNDILKIDEDFYLRYHKLIENIAYRILIGEKNDIKYDVEDCVNEIFAALMTKISEYNPQRGTIETYISVISRSVALNFRKKLKRSQAVTADLNEQNHQNQQIDIADNSDKYNEFADSEAVKESLQSLTKDEKTLFVLKYVYYYTAAEIAEYCGISPAAAEKRSARLRKKLQKLLKEKGF